MTRINRFKPIKGFSQRAILPSDKYILHQFEIACSALDGKTNLASLEEWDALVKQENLNTRSVIYINNLNEVAFVGWFEIDERVEEVLTFLEGRVHPEYRGQGYGSFLMDWLEGTAENRMKNVANGRPCTYRIMYYDRAQDAIKLFEERAFKLLYIEQEMQRDLREFRPKYETQDLEFNPWSTENSPEFYSVYRAAFQTRTEKLLESAAWHQHFADPNCEDFLPGLSLLVYKSGFPVAYAVIHSEESAIDKRNETAWISQLGVHSDFRRQGIGTILLSEIMKQFSQTGYSFIKISVNVNNQGAISLYEHSGFQLVNSFTMYHRSLFNSNY